MIDANELEIELDKILPDQSISKKELEVVNNFIKHYEDVQDFKDQHFSNKQTVIAVILGTLWAQWPLLRKLRACKALFLGFSKSMAGRKGFEPSRL